VIVRELKDRGNNAENLLSQGIEIYLIFECLCSLPELIDTGLGVRDVGRRLLIGRAPLAVLSFHKKAQPRKRDAGCGIKHLRTGASGESVVRIGGSGFETQKGPQAIQLHFESALEGGISRWRSDIAELRIQFTILY
jgi:hypothetical protein